jgi:signal transduction histidine kinase
MPFCPIKNPVFRTRALILFEAVRLVLILAIIAWWGWLLVDKTRYIISLESELMLRDSSYLPERENSVVLRMVYAEAATLIFLVLVSSLISFWLCVRDIRRNRALQLFFAASAHELRTSLASIRLQAEGVALTQGDSPYLQRLCTDTMRLEAQMERGLELARHESGKPLAIRPISLNDSLERSVMLFPASLWEHLVISRQLDEDYQVLADNYALQIIFRNIIENAVTHGKASVLSITAIRSPEKPLLTLIFQDNGNQGTAENGLSNKMLGTMFRKGKSSSGTGLGLYLIRSLMKQQGGKAEFSFTLHGGFRVALTLTTTRSEEV